MINNYSQYQSPMCLISNLAFKKAKRGKGLKNLYGYRKFDSAHQYSKLFFPLLQNEYYRSIARDEKGFFERLLDKESYPLTLRISNFNNDNNAAIEVKIESEIDKQDPMIKQKELWKYRHYSDYLVFKESFSYIGAIYILDPDYPDHYRQYLISLAIFKNKDNEQHLILPNSITLYFPLGTLVNNSKIYFQPICALSAYRTETECLFQLDKCPYYQLILNPIEENNNVQTSKFAELVEQQEEFYTQKEEFTEHFNKEQILAIKKALNFHKRFTIIKGPPGTGKTQTIIGIISIMAEMLIYKENEKTGAILILAKSNSVVNDLVRKIQKNIQEQNSIIYCFKQKPDYLKVVRFGRPNLCDQDIEQHSLEIQSQNQFFQLFRQKIKEIEKQCITEKINQLMNKNKIDDHQEYLNLNKQQITLISLLNYIDDLNRYCKDSEILNAYGKFYQDLSKLLQTEKKQYEEIEQNYLQKCHIVVSTLNSCSKECLRKYFEEVNFRMCIIDEAPTALEPALLIPMVKYPKIEKIVLLGDLKQLSPIVVASESKNFGYNRSLFERLAAGLTESTTQLIYQYRQMDNLAEITSELFYDKIIKNGNENMQFPTWISQKVSKGQNRLFFSAPSQTESREETSRKNDLECQAIISLIKYLLEGLDLQQYKNQITVISGYAAQKKNLFQQLQNEIFQEQTDQKGRKKKIKLSDLIELDTVDSFQGKENEIIILSLVRSNEQAGFLTDKKRTNVALSRAKYCQYIFGTYETMKRSLKNWKKIFELLTQKEIINYKQQDLQNPNFFKTILKLE
ncbi:unnamed protein product [Paramecium pentaurelia]|uniref:Uncharacterized protein n=1 Tax=Paramecium pentaurelia TaxID=43138 RepID=A0A8S1VJM5_9CILI|nr:unnamed protein product [Paramecium pentaurelia]